MAEELGLAVRLRELFRPEANEAQRKATLVGAMREPNDKFRCRALGECLDILVAEADAEGCKHFLLEVPVDDQWSAMVGMEDWMDENRQKQLEKKFNKLIPPRQFAALMKQNPEL